MNMRMLALLTIATGGAVLGRPAPAAASIDPVPPVRYSCKSDMDGDGYADMHCFGRNGCEVTASGCRGW
jgi:hypothetical protein